MAIFVMAVCLQLLGAASNSSLQDGWYMCMELRVEWWKVPALHKQGLVRGMDHCGGKDVISVDAMLQPCFRFVIALLGCESFIRGALEGRLRG